MKCFFSLGMLCAGTLLFSGCMSSENQNIEEHANVGEYIDLQSIVAEEQKKSAYFTLENQDKNTVLLVLHNPKKEAIQSFQTEILFPSHLASVSNLTNLSEETFALHMKSDWGIESEKGKIFLASTVSGASKNISERIEIAEFTFEKKEEKNTFIFDIQEHASKILQISQQNMLTNIIDKNQTKDLIIE